MKSGEITEAAFCTMDIEDTKTKNGERFVSMSPQVASCFRRIIDNRKKPRKEPMIDGYTGFLFLDKNEMPMVALHWEKYFSHIWKKYNSKIVVHQGEIEQW